MFVLLLLLLHLPLKDHTQVLPAPLTVLQADVMLKTTA
jgi:hypothetical protein